MSIHNLLNKIKGKTGIDKVTFMYLFIIVGVGIASFGLGRLSVENIGNTSDIAITEGASVYGSKFITNTKTFSDNSTSNTKSGIEKKYVASKHGKLYYTSGCAGAKRIKPENEVWFEEASDAESAGYSASPSCK